jgi:hypothetical protein
MISNAAPERARRARRIDLGLVLWTSFLAACAASLMFFDVVDPALLQDAGPRLFAHLDREAGYAIGFIFFWGIGAIASALSVYLMRTERGAGSRKDERGA